MNECNCEKKTPRSDDLVNNLLKRLNRISGQISGVSKMIQENRYCNDVLIQIVAIESALKEVGYMVLEEHMLTCVSDDIKNNDMTSLKEALEISKKLK